MRRGLKDKSVLAGLEPEEPMKGAAQGEDRLQIRERQQAAVAELGQRALGGIDLQELMYETASSLATTLEVENTKILELLPSGDALLLRAGVGWKDGLIGKAIVG